MKHIIDIDTWERRDNYNFFRTFHNSWISITSEVECGEALAAAKASGRSFFPVLSLCHTPGRQRGEGIPFPHGQKRTSSLS